ncbi:MAG: hypothetical protein DRG50_00355 [Deltaproteobacteria bacterium]|nr:MAG: hypothetical protein DRG50_00355 [Deltaproteobacteria bacterium]
MKIIEALLDHLPWKDAPVRKVRVGPFWTAVATRGCGLASTMVEDHPHRTPAVQEAGELTDRSAGELAHLALSSHLLEASIGMATINSLLKIELQRCSETNAFDILAAKGKGKDVAIIGHFPFVPALKKVARHLWVIEKRPQQGDLEAERAKDILPQCQVVGITGTSLINHTLESLLDLCRGSFVMLIGPTAPLTPLLFEYGIDAISGSQVVDEHEVLRYVSQGATFRQLHRHGVKLLTMMK